MFTPVFPRGNLLIAQIINFSPVPFLTFPPVHTREFIIRPPLQHAGNNTPPLQLNNLQQTLVFQKMEKYTFLIYYGRRKKSPAFDPLNEQKTANKHTFLGNYVKWYPQTQGQIEYRSRIEN